MRYLDIAEDDLDYLLVKMNCCLSESARNLQINTIKYLNDLQEF